MKVTDAYAFYGNPSLGGKEKVIVVVVSNSAFIKTAIDKYWAGRAHLNAILKMRKPDLSILNSAEWPVPRIVILL